MTKPRRRVIHFNHSMLWDVNLCGVRGTWHANGDPKKVTCKRCRGHLSYWVYKELRKRSVPAQEPKD